HDFDVSAGGDREARGGVAQFVGVQPRHADHFGSVVVGGATEYRCTERSRAADPGEDEVVGCLTPHMLRELIDEKSRDRHLALLVSFRRTPYLRRTDQG